MRDILQYTPPELYFLSASLFIIAGLVSAWEGGSLSPFVAIGILFIVIGIQAQSIADFIAMPQ